MKKDRVMSDDVVELPEGVPECDREFFEAMMEAASKFAKLSSSLAGSVGIVVRSNSEDGDEFRPMNLIFECSGKKEDRPRQCQRAIIAMYIDQIHTMVEAVRNGSLRDSFSEVLEDAARSMREIGAEPSGPADVSKAN